MEEAVAAVSIHMIPIPDRQSGKSFLKVTLRQVLGTLIIDFFLSEYLQASSINIIFHFTHMPTIFMFEQQQRNKGSTQSVIKINTNYKLE